MHGHVKSFDIRLKQIHFQLEPKAQLILESLSTKVHDQLVSNSKWNEQNKFCFNLKKIISFYCQMEPLTELIIGIMWFSHGITVIRITNCCANLNLSVGNAVICVVFVLHRSKTQKMTSIEIHTNMYGMVSRRSSCDSYIDSFAVV